jgi:hypothetical protein
VEKMSYKRKPDKYVWSELNTRWNWQHKLTKGKN